MIRLLFLILTLSAGTSRAITKNELPFFDSKDLTPYWPTTSPDVHESFRLPQLEAVDQNRSPVTEKTLRGHVSLVHFFFASCASQCPVMISTLKNSQTKLKAANLESHTYSISTQPESDSPERLKTYAHEHHLDPSGWSLLRMDSARLSAFTRLLVKTKLADSDSTSHSTIIYLIDQNLRLRGIYDSLNPQQMAELEGDVASLPITKP